jgi:hypothetical protein
MSRYRNLGAAGVVIKEISCVFTHHPFRDEAKVALHFA